jgi:CheY-like chemotaxis protein
MTLSALLVCEEKTAADVLERVLQELGVEVEPCPDFVRAGVRAAQKRFDVIIVEGSSSGAVMSLLRDTRLSRLNDSTLAVAVVPSQDSIRELFSLGVNFVLYKPVAYDRALSSLRAARAVMRKEKRRGARAAVHTQATVDYANVQHEKATLVNIGQDGMALMFGKKLPPTGKMYFQFKFPGQSASVRLSGILVWQEWNGRGGVQFVDVPQASRKLLEQFLGANLPRDGARREVSDVTVEMEEPLQLATVSVVEQTHGGVSKPRGTGDDRLVRAEGSDESVADATNRRSQVRYNCRLSAEVYRTGTSVPIHCRLTDLSAGGCYLEVPLPFTAGSPVGIVVRSYGLKLELRGVVQAAHPGHGMGIAFELNTRNERANVKKLTDYVASTTPSS